MKRTLAMILAIVMCLSCGVLLASCGHECEWAADWSKDATHHWKACTDTDCTEVSEKAEHTWGAGVETAFGATQYTCSVCQQTKVDKKATTVADDKWDDAFKFGTNFVASMKMTHPTEGAEAMSLSREGGKLAMTEVYTDSQGDSDEYTSYAYVDGSTVYMFYDNGEGDQHDWQRRVYPYMTGEDFIAQVEQQMVSDEFRVRSLYTYSEATNLYTAASVTIGGDTCTNVSLGFIDGKLVKFSYSYVDDGATITVEASITYGGATVTLPNVNGTVTAQQYAEQIDFTGSNFEVIHTVKGSTTSSIAIGYYGDRVRVGNNVYYYYDSVNSVYYQIVSTWNSKVVCSQDAFECYKGYMLQDVLSFDKLTYDADLQAYRCASAVIASEQATDIIVFFDNGELDSITYKTVSGGSTKTNTITYNIPDYTPSIPGFNG